MEKDIAIKAENISKTFRIPHEKISSLRGAFVNAFRSHGYEEFKAVDDVSFEVKKGEFFGIIGRNGSGKSTLLKILAGIYQPDKGKGKVKVNGLISPFLELGIGFNPELSGRDNVYLNAAVLGLTHKQIDEKFDDIVEFSELRRFIDQKVKNYSSGMQVRLMFSTAIHANREILIMDEVLAVGDTNFQSKCMEEFNKYKDAGKTVILVTHDTGTVQRYCDRAMLLRDGRIEIIGNSERVCSKYIYQNMSDEEKRLHKEERKKDDESMKNKIGGEEIQKDTGRQGTKEIIIEKVDFLDNNHNPKKVFETFEDIAIRVHFRLVDDIKEAVFGIEIFNSLNQVLFGFHTKMREKVVRLDAGKNYIDFRIEENPFLTGRYYVNLGIANKDCTKQYYYWSKAGEFTIMNRGYEKNYLGDVNVKLEINE